jgi:hypothetical protein
VFACVCVCVCVCVCCVRACVRACACDVYVYVYVHMCVCVPCCFTHSVCVLCYHTWHEETNGLPANRRKVESSSPSSKGTLQAFLFVLVLLDWFFLLVILVRHWL